MAPHAAFLDWGAAVSFGYLAGVNVAAVQLPFVLGAFAIIIGVVTLWARPRRFAWYLVELGATMLIARYVLIPLIRLFVQSLRPYAALDFVPFIDPVHEFSFPSGHTAVLTALAFVAWSIRPAVGAALLLGAVVVGIARVYAGVHWPIDIFGGAVVGALSALIVTEGYKRLFPDRNHKVS